MADESQLQIDEYTLVEKPALDLFDKLGYNYLDGKKLKKEPQQFFLLDILKRKIQEINPWLDEVGLNKAVREITVVQAASLVEANELLYYKLVNYTSFKQDLGFGKKSQTVKFIDFDEPEKNEFTVVNQFYVKNNDFTIIPDLVVFVNGIPLAVLECKSPNLQEPIDEAISQLFGYREKNEQFFYPNQILVALARYRATYASTFSPAKYFLEWKKPYPLNERELVSLLGKEGKELPAQDILLYSLFSKENFLDILRSYIVFETENNGVNKKLCRYNQYIASNKILERMAEGKGGVIWHTQGSGKSLTMTYTALKIRRIEKVPGTSLENPCILIVTDRNDLDSQISGTFKNCSFPNPVPVESVEQLKDELKTPTGKTLFTTIQKFTSKNGETYPELSSSENIIVFADEAHRSQYGKAGYGKTAAKENKEDEKVNTSLGWALNMRTAIPNALFIGFTGTPIDKNDKSTRREFGDYIDRYLPKQSIADGATVQIKYQARLPKVHILGSELDVAFDSEFADYTDLEQEAIKEKAGKYRTIAEDEDRIRVICKDILEHYTTAVRPEGFKAQIVTPSRDAAVTYKWVLDELEAPESEIIISSSPKDEPHAEIRKYYRTKARQRQIIKKFRKPFDEENKLAFLIVCDMLLTGFDAPIEQVMYLDKPLREHNLMQAVARVNRPYTENKTHGLIIDYCGISKRLKEALDIFNEGDIAGYLEHLMDDVPKAEQAANKVKRFFKDVPTTYDSAEYVDRCVLDVLSAEDTRIRFERAFKEFVALVNNIIPNPEANRFRQDVYLYGRIYNAMRTNYSIKAPSVLEAVPKAKALIHEYLESNGIKVFHDPVSIYSSEFNDIVNKKTSQEAKASLIQHKVRTTISNLLNTNPIYYTSLREKLEKLIAEHEQELISTTAFLADLDKIKAGLDVEVVARKHGMSREEFAVFQMVRAAYIQLQAGAEKASVNPSVHLTEEDEKKLAGVSLSLFSSLNGLAVIDWRQKPEQQKIMLKTIKRELYKIDFDIETAERESHNILNLARNLL
ncbi:type I restriction endonuclease subunit R [Methanosarcina sp. WH1]|uniref:type I restriction endonuclease subunit R n=1 Tax=Methanosarcina sp. WH1 TaxID=1434102 RepID=UPI0006155907|nr:HsdR family type I site-specific deoxyribonuclease [Methanosarcina sp. WH1]AKB21733.1 Type I restriction-modification system, restriction subunit R [Methanosarcina sp. WH1]